jgi:hypothetical protein
MTNQIESIHVAQTSESRSVPGRFELAMRGAASGLLHGVGDAVDLAAPFVPAGTVVSAAVRSVAGAAAGTATGSAAGGVGGSETDLLSATRALQQQSQSFNLEYLQLQEGLQRENREFTTLSNIMKVKHDSAKNSIQNIH